MLPEAYRGQRPASSSSAFPGSRLVGGLAGTTTTSPVAERGGRPPAREPPVAAGRRPPGGGARPAHRCSRTELEASPTSSTASSFSGPCRWVTRSWPSTSAPGAQHPGQCGLRQHHSGRRVGRGLDPSGPVRRVVVVRRRRDERDPARVDGGRIPRGRRGRDRRGGGEAAVPFDCAATGRSSGWGAAAVVVRPRARPDSAASADRRGARHRDREQRLPRHPARSGSHPPGHGGSRGDG